MRGRGAWGRSTALIVAAAALCQPAAAAAAGPTPWDSCFAAAGARYQVPPLLLKAIARQESSMNPRAVGKNTNGTVDLGLMQINSSHLGKLSRAGITQAHLMDPCTNINVGAWVLADGVRRFGMSWKAVGVYHSPTPWRQQNYATLVSRHLAREIQAVQRGTAPAPLAPPRREGAAIPAPQGDAGGAARASVVWEAGDQ